MADELLLRRVDHPMATDNYRVIWNDGERDFEIGAIGAQVAAGSRTFWSWGIDTVVPSGNFPTHGEATDRADAMERFRRAWGIFSADAERLRRFLQIKAAADR